MQKSQSKILIVIANAPWYVTNRTLHTDFNITYVSDVIHGKFNTHHNKLEAHPNPLLEPLTQPTNAIRRVQVNQHGFKLNGIHQLLAYADDVNILGGSIHTLKENAEVLVPATREIGLEVNADKTKYMVMSRDQNAGRIHSVRIDNSTFERVEEFKY